jgi:hypothetical protein
MAAPPAGLVPNISPAEMQILLSRAGLVLNPGQIADLVLAWRQLAGLIAGIPQGRELVDDFAFAFRVPAPEQAPGAVQAPGRGKAGRVARPPAKTARKAGGKLSAKPRVKGARMVRAKSAAKSAGRKPAAKRASRRR